MGAARRKIKNNDLSVRKKLIEHLSLTQNTVLEEFDLERGRVRADVVAVKNSQIHGYEIKSDLDTLLRLPRQVKSYNQVFSTNTLVVGAEHVVKALYIIPNWWGVIVAEDCEGEIILNCIREPQHNETVNYCSVAELFKRNELVNLLVQHEPSRSFSKMSKTGLIRETNKALTGEMLMTGLTSTLVGRLQTA